MPVSSRAGYGGLIRDWLPACQILPRYIEADELHRFFEDYFNVYLIETEEEINKLTGYYEPQINASYEPVGERTAPIPQRPDDLIEVRLGRFEDSLDGRVIWGKVQGSELVLYPERADIENAPEKAIGFATPADVFSCRFRVPVAWCFRMAALFARVFQRIITVRSGRWPIISYAPER